MKTKVFLSMPLFLGILLMACDPIPSSVDPTPVPVSDDNYKGLYVLNEGGYNQNNASLDYLDWTTGVYTTDTFTHANPSLVQGLGDVGNDILIYGSKAYICVNGSGLVEIIDAHSAQHVAQVALNNCRKLCAYEGYVYVTSYAGRVEDANHQLGLVAKIDTLSLAIVDSCEVGYQPEGMAVVSNKMYVANSGGYVGMNTGTYDNRVSVINLATFTLVKHLTLAPNPQDILVDSRQQLWISAYGNYSDIASNLYCLNPQTEQITAQGVPVTKMTMLQDTLVLYATTYDASWNAVTSFSKIDTKTSQIIPLSLSSAITSPNGLCVHPTTGNIYVADAGDYVNPGCIYCFTRTGTYRWKLYAGVAPGHFAWL